MSNRDISSLNQLEELAKETAQNLKNERFCIVFLNGTLGSGKTTYTQLVAKALGIQEDIQSPTYALLREYKLTDLPAGLFLHMDLYRIEDAATLEQYGILDLFAQKQGIFFIEWPQLLEERFRQAFKGHCTTLHFEVDPQTNSRTVRITQ